ncbi:MAG: 4-alpha-glucanotransferase [Pseudomonadota bacterium]
MKPPALPDDLRALALRHGIALSYRDMAGVERFTGVETALALLRANGVSIDKTREAKEILRTEEADASPFPRTMVVPAQKAFVLPSSWEMDHWGVMLEDGCKPLHKTPLEGNGRRLPGFPMGVHELSLKTDGPDQRVLLIAAPPAAPLVTQPVWGVTGALYGLPHENGMGTLGDLGDWGAALGALGASFFGINPIHALGFYEEEITSPYSPSHRGFLNVHHLGLGHGAVAGPDNGLLNYKEVLAHSRARLRARFEEQKSRLFKKESQPRADGAKRKSGDLADFARFEALTARHGSDSRTWPRNAWQEPVAREELDFHMDLQWWVERELEQAQNQVQAGGLKLGLYLDLAVGARRGGAEDYLGRSVMASNVSIGAPGDHLAPAGQNWNLCGFSPAKLARQKYDALRKILRANFQHAGMVRIDHVLGLARSFWIPDDGSPGGYIAHNFEVMLALVALEAARAGTVVVGEDLGLVPEGFREATAARGLYGYSALQYEHDGKGALSDGQNLRPQSLACFATHDTPTVEGFRVGRDIDWWEKLGWVDAPSAAKARTTRSQDVMKLTGGAEGGASLFRTTVHEKLARSPAQMVAVQLDDLLGHKEAQNLPGTVDEHPNWQRRYNAFPDELAQHPTMRETAKLMAKAGRTAGK